jgi:hypothetical protein
MAIAAIAIIGTTTKRRAFRGPNFDRLQMRNIPRIKLKIKTIKNSSEIVLRPKKSEGGYRRTKITTKNSKVPQKTIHGYLAHHRNPAVIALGIISFISLTPTDRKV